VAVGTAPLIPRLLLDTNAVSDFAESEPAIMELLAEVQVLALPVVVVGEYRFGIAQARNVADYHLWLERLITQTDVLNITDETTIHYAEVRLDLKRIGRPIPMNDVWIAALCRQHELPILSRDQHFDVVPKIKRLAW
jgi:predicted nucleic acid-binding protein